MRDAIKKTFSKYVMVCNANKTNKMITEIIELCWEALSSRDVEWVKVVEEILDYIEHANDCILSLLSAGERTPDGGYRQKFAGKWYQSRVVEIRKEAPMKPIEKLFPAPVIEAVKAGWDDQVIILWDKLNEVIDRVNELSEKVEG